MGLEDSAFGREDFSFGPGYMYADTQSGGENLLLGDTDSIKIKFGVSKTDLKSSQKGNQPADRAVDGQTCEITMGLAMATLARLEQVQAGFIVDRDTDGNPRQLFFSKVIGQRDSARATQYTFKEIIDGVEATEEDNPMHIIDFPKCCPKGDPVELTFDAATQRYYGTMLFCYESDELDNAGRKVYFKSRRKV